MSKTNVSDTNEQARKWEQPTPLRDTRLPSFPADALPAWLRMMVEGVATETQTPVDLAAMLALGAISTAVGKRFTVHVQGGWSETLTFSSVTALEPAARKSAVFASMFEALRAIDARMEGRRIFADDATPEALASLMYRNDGFAAIASPEGGIFRHLDRRVPNLDIYLKGYTGEDHRIDRVERSETIRRPCLPMNVTVQPRVIESLGRMPDVRGRGLLARLCWAIPRSTIGERQANPPIVPETVRRIYATRVLTLATLPVPSDEPWTLELTDEAYERVVMFQQWLEPRLTPTGELYAVQDWAGKLTGTVIRIAGLLHIASRSGKPETILAPIGSEQVDQATRIAKEHLIEHAMAAFHALGEDEGLRDAELIFNWIKRNELRKFSRREAHRGNKTIGRESRRLTVALDLLNDYHYIRRIDRPDGQTGRPSEQYVVNPAVPRMGAKSAESGTVDFGTFDTFDTDPEPDSEPPTLATLPAPAATANDEDRDPPQPSPEPEPPSVGKRAKPSYRLPAPEPLFGYPGGKSVMRDDLLARLIEVTPPHIREYRDPFVGGGSVMLAALASGRFDRIVTNDLHKGIAAVWACAFDSRLNKDLQWAIHTARQPTPESLKRFCEAMEAGVLTDPVQMATGKIALHRCTFNSLGEQMWNRNFEGGDFSKWLPHIPMRQLDKIAHCIRALGLQAQAMNGDFLHAMDSEDAAYFVDAPYFGPQYSEDGKQLYQHYLPNEQDHVRLAERLKSMNAPFVMTYDDHPMVRDLYQWAHIERASVVYKRPVKDADKERARAKQRAFELVITRKAAEVTHLRPSETSRAA